MRERRGENQTYANVPKQKETMLFWGQTWICKNIHMKTQQHSCTRREMKRMNCLSVGIHTKKHFLHTDTSERLTVPGGLVWFGTVILLWHLWSLLPNPNFKQTQLTCSMFLGRSGRATKKNSRARERGKRMNHEDGEQEKYVRRNGEEEEGQCKWKSTLGSIPKMESSETQEQNNEDEWKAAGGLVTGIKNLVSFRQNS